MIVQIIKILNKFLLEFYNNKKDNTPSLRIKNPHNFSDLSNISNLFIEKSTLIKEKEIKIKGLLIDQTFYFYENFNKSQIKSALQLKDKNDLWKYKSSKLFSREKSIEKNLNNLSMDSNNPINANNDSDQTNKQGRLIESNIIDSKYLKDMKKSTFLFKKGKTFINSLKKNLVHKTFNDYEHFSALFSTEEKHQKLYEILQVLLLCHFTKSKIDRKNFEVITEHMNPEDQAIFEFASRHDASFESFLVVPKNNIKCFNIKINGIMQTFPILGVNEFTDVRNRFSIVLHNTKEDNAVLLMRCNHHSLLEILDMNEIDKSNLKVFLDNMKTFGYRYIIYARKELDMIEASHYIQKYNICKTSLTIEQNELNKFYSEFENNSKLVTVLFVKDKLVVGII